GGPGNWHFKTTVLIDSDTWPYARCPNLAADDSGNIFVVYNRVFITGEDTVTDCGVFARPAHQDTWYDWGRCTFNGNIGYMEVAHNAPLIANGDSTIIGLIYTDAGSYPNSGGLYFDCIILPNPPIPPWVGDKEKHSALPSQPKILVSPNPAHNLVKFVTSSPITSLQIYDVTGRLVI
ncbi:MAG: T9SS type A sorting domain-containing protein, partial [candidate division WOR-3 bacterium]